VSAELRHAEHPDSFLIPEREERESLAPGDAAKLLFDIKTREAGPNDLSRRREVFTRQADPQGRGPPAPRGEARTPADI
jgi:hypothetical protein